MGRSLADLETSRFAPYIHAMFGYHVVQLGHLRAGEDLLQDCPARNHVVMGLDREPDGAHIVADATRLPIPGDSVDGVLLPHTLDFARDPHQLLREVERILIPEGKVLISGFNPWSQWGAWRLMRLRANKAPWCGHFFSSGRVADWLALLGFDLLDLRCLHYRPPLKGQGVMQKLHFMERLGEQVYPKLGGVYIIHAVKRVATLTPMRPRWTVKKTVLPTAAEPTIRNGIE
ncbi:MAG: class I SAM-dependent methyltransferase [Candidatus Thiodiazotropha sp.]